MPDDERTVFHRVNIEKLLQQIEESLTHSREIIDQIDMIRQLRLRVGKPQSSSASRFTAGAFEFLTFT